MLLEQFASVENNARRSGARGCSIRPWSQLPLSPAIAIKPKDIGLYYFESSALLVINTNLFLKMLLSDRVLWVKVWRDASPFMVLRRKFVFGNP